MKVKPLIVLLNDSVECENNNKSMMSAAIILIELKGHTKNHTVCKGFLCAGKINIRMINMFMTIGTDVLTT